MTNDSTVNHFDRMLGSLDGLPGVVHTKATTVRALTPLIGAAQTFIVQTYRQREAKEGKDGQELARGRDTIFLEYVGADGQYRLVIPPDVADTIARQRDALTSKTRSRVGKENAAARKAAGLEPGFAKARKPKRILDQKFR